MVSHPSREGIGEGGHLSDSMNSAIKVISTPERIRQQYLTLIRNSNRELLMVFPTVNSIHREKSIGVLDELQNAVKRGVRIRILSAEDDFIKGILDNLRASGIIVRKIETPTETKFKMLVVDKSQSFVVETKDDSRSQFHEAVGLATHSNSKATVLPFVTIFESFWRETDLYEKARESDKVKDEFVNIAAHELRTPITPIVSGSEFLRETVLSLKGRVEEQTLQSLVDTSNLIIRSASKLHRLSEDILQVSRIDAGTFKLAFTLVDIDLLIRSVVGDIEMRYAGQKSGIKVLYDPPILPNGIRLKRQVDEVGAGPEVYCDEEKVSRVLYNILDNAVKFSEEGPIRVTCFMNMKEKEVTISVRDNGTGIDAAVKPVLFEKFSGKSKGGTGIGLFLSKKIVEAHNGRIWADENRDGRGTTFWFSLPLDNMPP